MNKIELTQREIELEIQIKNIIKDIRYGKLVFSTITTDPVVLEAKKDEDTFTYTEKVNGKLLIRSFFINEKEVKFGQIRHYIRKLDNAIKKGCKIGSRSKPKNSIEEREFFKLVDENKIIKNSEFEYRSNVSDVSSTEVPEEDLFKLTIEIKPTPQGGKKTYRRLYKNGVLVSERAKLIYCEKHFK